MPINLLIEGADNNHIRKKSLFHQQGAEEDEHSTIQMAVVADFVKGQIDGECHNYDRTTGNHAPLQ